MKFQPGKPAFEAIAGSHRCAATAKQTGQRCRQIASPGRAVCRFHGGASLRGREHPNYQHGDATQAARAMAIWFNTMARVVGRLNRARTPAEEKKAVAFAYEVLARQPGRG